MAERSVNQVTLLGRLGKDAETKFNGSGTAKTTFSIATTRRWKDKDSGDFKEVTDWHNVVLWRSENLASHLTKGKQVYIQGRIETRSWDDQQSGQKKYITEVVADNVILLGGREQSEERPVSTPRSSSRPAPAPQAESFDAMGISDEDVPFMRYDVPCM